MRRNLCLSILALVFTLVAATLLGSEVLALMFEQPWRAKDTTIRNYWLIIRILQVVSIIISIFTSLTLLISAINAGLCWKPASIKGYHLRTQLATITFFAFGFLAIGSQILLFEHFRRISLFLYADAANFALLALLCSCQRMELIDEMRVHEPVPANNNQEDEDVLNRWICTLENSQRHSFSAPVGKVLREMRQMSLVESQLSNFHQI
ncbi:unnamed protein product [Bursaphelenchus xylophilus]|uniref:(pine wood nematode) hypothetical protein n=1 Tax=Bursaphelenchus xylophilus TaxID=6326 RepID=A0A1I7SFE1_BURXY|nr:unnamed protein product [Bursaphelenchus xylophilus]CAG9092788.1 unnamed protein product [Bursaphelenchus xylophilus]